MIKLTSLTAGDSAYNVKFEWDEEVGVPGAFIIKNNHTTEFFLKTLTLQDVPGEGRVVFVCNSWVYPASKYNYDRIFFRNQVLCLYIYVRDINISLHIVFVNYKNYFYFLIITSRYLQILFTTICTLKYEKCSKYFFKILFIYFYF